MPASTVEDELLYHSAKAGDVVRQLGFAALAAVWLFHDGTTSAPWLPGRFQCTVVLVIASLGLDAVQYIVGSLVWGVKTVRHQGALEAAKQKGAVGTLLAIVFVKVALMLAAYVDLLRALAASVGWTR